MLYLERKTPQKIDHVSICRNGIECNFKQFLISWSSWTKVRFRQTNCLSSKLPFSILGFLISEIFIDSIDFRSRYIYNKLLRISDFVIKQRCEVV